MAEIKWIKIVTDIFDDEKILLIESMPDKYAIITIWFKLLCLAGKQNNHGIFLLNDKIPFTDEMLATIFRMELNTVRLALETFSRFGMIEIIDGVITIPNWEKHQQVEGLDKIREQTRNRVRSYRERQKQLVECSVTSELHETVCNGLEEDKNKKDKNKKFIPPTLEEVKAYVAERNSNVDPIKFWEYYEAGDWKDSKGNSVKNWKQKLLTWEKKDGVKNEPKRNAPVSNDPKKWDTDSFKNAIGDLLNG